MIRNKDPYNANLPEPAEPPPNQQRKPHWNIIWAEPPKPTQDCWEKNVSHRSDLVPPSIDTCCSISGMFKVKLIYCEMFKKQDLQLYGNPPWLDFLPSKSHIVCLPIQKHCPMQYRGWIWSVYCTYVLSSRNWTHTQLSGLAKDSHDCMGIIGALQGLLAGDGWAMMCLYMMFCIWHRSIVTWLIDRWWSLRQIGFWAANGR